MKFYDQITPKIPERIEEKHVTSSAAALPVWPPRCISFRTPRCRAKTLRSMKARPNLGGCLEAFGSAEDGYLSTGAREPEPYFQCMGITASSEFS